MDLMPDNYDSSSVSHAERLVNFFTITDIHITDEETPASAIFYGLLYSPSLRTSSGYSPVMLLTTQVLDAAIQTINVQHLQKPFDFGISLGDAINNNQRNELLWYIGVMDGLLINPDSGVKDN
ncbi:MAG: TIGR03768 family metallophosphoesterase, partial [Methanoregula sp.]|nr:TIGR03768 family metallophosphoesterase [Methanoregula sp.]